MMRQHGIGDCRFYRAGHTDSIMQRKYFRQRLSRTSNYSRGGFSQSGNGICGFTIGLVGDIKSTKVLETSSKRRSVIVARLRRRHAFIDDANDAVVPQKRLDTLSWVIATEDAEMLRSPLMYLVRDKRPIPSRQNSFYAYFLFLLNMDTLRLDGDVF